MNGTDNARPLVSAGFTFRATLALLMAFASISTDLYLPAMPIIARQFSAEHGYIELTLSAFLVGFSVGQLVWGPLSDAIGRKTPLVLGMLLFVMGTIACGLSQSVGQMITARVIQALGACVGPVIARAIVRDSLEHDAAARMLSNLALIMAVAPIVGPVLGGQVLLIASWRAIFWILAGIGGLSMVAIQTLPETLPPDRRPPSSARTTGRIYFELLCDGRFMAYSGALGSFYSAIYAYIAASPFAYMEYYGVSAQVYGLLFGLVIIGIFTANAINARLVMRFGARRLFKLGCRLAMMFSAITAIVAITGLGGLPTLVCGLILTIATSGFIASNGIAGALASQGSRAGAASALLGAIQFGGGIFGSAATGWLANGTPSNLGWVMLASGICVWVFGRIATASSGLSAASQYGA